jgi:hypothetical protein
MGIAKFETGAPEIQGTSTNSGGSSKTLIMIAVVGLIAYLGYKFIIKPEQDKKKQENDNRQPSN